MLSTAASIKRCDVQLSVDCLAPQQQALLRVSPSQRHYSATRAGKMTVCPGTSFSMSASRWTHLSKQQGRRPLQSGASKPRGTKKQASHIVCSSNEEKLSGTTSTPSSADKAASPAAASSPQSKAEMLRKLLEVGDTPPVSRAAMAAAAKREAESSLYKQDATSQKAESATSPSSVKAESATPPKPEPVAATPPPTSPPATTTSSNGSTPLLEGLPFPLQRETANPTKGVVNPLQVLSAAERMQMAAAKSIACSDDQAKDSWITQSKHRKAMSELRRRLSSKLSKANAVARIKDKEYRMYVEALKNSNRILNGVEIQLNKAINDASLAGESAHAEGNQIESLAFLNLKNNFISLREDIQKYNAGASGIVLKPVSISWQGVGSDVKLMGSFDGWTNGQAVGDLGCTFMSPMADVVKLRILSCHVLQLYSVSESHDTYRDFHAEIMLRPGRYEVKLYVDGMWVLIDDLPRNGDGLEANNVITLT